MGLTSCVLYDLPRSDCKAMGSISTSEALNPRSTSNHRLSAMYNVLCNSGPSWHLSLLSSLISAPYYLRFSWKLLSKVNLRWSYTQSQSRCTPPVAMMQMKMSTSVTNHHQRQINMATRSRSSPWARSEK